MILLIGVLRFLIHGTTKRNGKNSLEIRLFSLVFFVLLSCWTEVYGADSGSKNTEADLLGRCSPIVMSPDSLKTIITQKLFTGKDYEIAILPSYAVPTDSFWAYIIQKDESGYRCETKRIKVSDVLIGNNISRDLLAECKVEINSKAIEGQSVKILANLLRDQVSTAAYHSKPLEWALGAVDGQTYDVYVKGRPGDVYPEYSGCIIDPFKRGSQSCSTITSVLNRFVLSDDSKKREEPLKKLINFLKSVADGKPDGDDPFVENQEPPPVLILPSP